MCVSAVFSHTTEISTFEKTVESLVDILSAQAEKIERQKLMAIGLRNKVESEAENRKRKQQEILADINQKKIELDRYPHPKHTFTFECAC